jgi:hypothetical protein
MRVTTLICFALTSVLCSTPAAAGDQKMDKPGTAKINKKDVDPKVARPDPREFDVLPHDPPPIPDDLGPYGDFDKVKPTKEEIPK